MSFEYAHEECGGLRGCGFEPHRRHCVVSLSKMLYPLLSAGSTQEDPSQHVEWDIKNQTKNKTCSQDKPLKMHVMVLFCHTID